MVLCLQSSGLQLVKLSPPRYDQHPPVPNFNTYYKQEEIAEVQSLDGRKWALATPVMFVFEYAKGGEAGVLLRKTKICGDGVPSVVRMLKLGIVMTEQLVG